MGNAHEWSSFEKYLIQRIDTLEDKLTDVRLKIAGMAVIISLATSFITATVVTKTKTQVKQPAIIDTRKER